MIVTTKMTLFCVATLMWTAGVVAQSSNNATSTEPTTSITTEPSTSMSNDNEAGSGSSEPLSPDSTVSSVMMSSTTTLSIPSVTMTTNMSTSAQVSPTSSLNMTVTSSTISSSSSSRLLLSSSMQTFASPSSTNLPSSSSSQQPTSPVTTDATTNPPSTTSPLPQANPLQWVGVGIGVVVLIVLALISFILCWCIAHKLSAGKTLLRKMSVSSNRKLIECALEEIPEGNKQNSEDYLFAHLTAAQLTSLPSASLVSYVEQLHEDDNYQAEEEYDEVKDLDQPAPIKHATMPCNESRNRYTNILPRDSTRVILSTISKVPGSDYINATFINGYTHPREYIAAQGPLPATCSDFWRMIWEHNVHIIVMVTNVEENGMIKCHQYWPSRGTSQYGGTVISLKSQLLYPEFIVREFSVTNNTKTKKASQVGVSRTVIQYHFTSWPDFGVPKEASAMIKFVRKIRRSIEPSDGPVVTHCSAGVGRTGTFIAVDILTQKMDARESVNVQEVVCQMRAQRSYMVQTSAQYLFIYDSIVHYHLYGKMEISGEDLVEYVGMLDTPSEDEDGSTPLDKEFKQLTSFRLSSDDLFSISLDDSNKIKNRNSCNIPLDDNRVVLDDVNLPAGQDYINASFVTGYYNRIEFVSTQHPLQSTMGDFWSMVLERNIKTIVMIGPLDEKEDCYWPTTSSEPRTFDGGASVSLEDTDRCIETGLIIRELRVQSVENTDKVLTVMHFHLHSWPVGGAPSETTPTLDLIDRSRESWRETGYNLILVHTSASVSGEAAGVYCGLCVLLRQLEVEDCVDVFTAVRKLRRQRPAIFTSKDYYRFVYSVLETSQQEQ